MRKFIRKSLEGKGILKGQLKSNNAQIEEDMIIQEIDDMKLDNIDNDNDNDNNE